MIAKKAKRRGQPDLTRRLNILPGPHIANNFPLCIPKIYLAKPIIMFCLELLYSIEYKMQPFSFQHREQHISQQDYEISVVEEIHISRLEPQSKDGPLNFLYPFLKYIVGIWH
jgi:hypothetical protein